MARSPNYPTVDLGRALERAQTVHQHEQRSAAPVPAILRHWGYGPKSSGGYGALAALKKFGLIEDEGHGERRKARLSDLALRILLDHRPDSKERQEAIQQAALTPPIHADLWERFGTEGSDASLEHYLMYERGFTQNGAQELIKEYRATLAFAGLTEPATVSENHIDRWVQPVAKGSSGIMNPPMSTPTGRPPVQGYAIPLPNNEGELVLQGPFPISKGAWEHLKRYLDLMESALSRESEPVDSYAGYDDPDEKVE